MKLSKKIEIVFLVMLVMIPLVFTNVVSGRSIALGEPNGHVIAFGHYIEPPYFVTVEENVLYVNGVQYFPREPLPSPEETAEWVYSREHYQAVQKLFEEINSQFYAVKTKRGLSAAKETVLQFVTQQPEVLQARFENDFAMFVSFTNGDHETILFDPNADATGPDIEYQEAREQELQELRHFVESQLQTGALFAFGYEYTLVVPPERAEIVLTRVASIKRMTISGDKKAEVLQGVLLDSDLVRDVLESESLFPEPVEKIRASSETPDAHTGIVFAPCRFEAKGSRGEAEFLSNVGTGGQQYGTLSYQQSSYPGTNPSVRLTKFRELVDPSVFGSIAIINGVFLITGHGNAEIVVVEAYGNDSAARNARNNAYNTYIAGDYTTDEIGKGTTSTGYYGICIKAPLFFTNKVNLNNPESLVYIAACQSGTLADDFVSRGARVAVGNSDSPLTDTNRKRVIQFFERMNGKEGKSKRNVANARAGLSLTLNGNGQTVLAPAVSSLTKSGGSRVQVGDKITVNFDTTMCSSIL